MTIFDTTVTVGQLVTDRPSRSRVFQELGIDFCCGGKKTLDQTCREKGLDLNRVVALLKEDDQAPGSLACPGNGVDPAALSLSQLCDHVERTHHDYLKRELPRLLAMAHKVASVHGGAHPWTVELHRVFVAMAAELDEHMFKEERVLFPWIRQLETGRIDPTSHCGGGTIANPIQMMEHEHDNAHNAMVRMNELSDGYTPPQAACNTFIAVLDGLKHLETDMHMHVHKENNILFPKALVMEGIAS